MTEEQLKFMKRVRDRLSEAETGWSDNRTRALDDVKHLDGEGQWPEKIKEERTNDGRPCLFVNRLPGFVDQVVGDERQNRPRIRVKPVDNKSDPEIAKILEGLIRNIEYTSHAEHAYDTAFEHGAGHGFGYFRILKEYAGEDTFEQNLVIRRVKNSFSVYPDPAAQEADYSDMRYCFVTEVITKDDFKARFPNATIPSDFEISSSTGTQYEGWFLSDKVRIGEYWEREPVKQVIVQLDNGIVMRKEDATPDRLMEMAVIVDPDTGMQAMETPPSIIKERAVKSWQVTQYIVSGYEVLEGPIKWDGQYIPIIPVLGKELVVDGKTIYRGVIRNAKDSQRAYNYWRSMATETVALQPRAPYLATTQQVAGYEDIWKNANRKSYSYLPYNSTGDPIPQRQFPASIPQGAFTEAQVAVDDMKATTGIYDASLGNRSNETSGKAIIARQREGDVGTFPFHDNLSRAIQHGGRILVEMIPKTYDTARVERIRNEDGTDKLIPINQGGIGKDGIPFILNDITVGKYDVVVEAGPSYSTQRQEAAESIVAFMQALPGQAPLMADIAAKNMDWPEADKIAQRLRKTLPQGIAEPEEGEGQPPPQDQPPNPAMELEAEKIKLEYAKLENEKMKLELERFRIEADLERERMRFAGATAGGNY